MTYAAVIAARVQETAAPTPNGGRRTRTRAISVLLKGDPTSAGSFQLSLLSDNSGAPCATIASSGVLPDSFLNSTPVPLVAGGAVSLAAGTRYWIEVSDVGGTSAQWAWSTDISGTGVAGEFFSNTSGVYPNANGPYQMEVSVTGVPEASTWAMMLAGFAGLGYAAARTRRQAEAIAI